MTDGIYASAFRKPPATAPDEPTELDVASVMLRECWLLLDDIARYGIIIGMDKAQRMACNLLRKHKARGWGS